MCATSSGAERPHNAPILPRDSVPAVQVAILAAVTMLGQESHPALLPLKEQLLPMLQQLLSPSKPQDSSKLQLLGRCWLALATGILHLYVPDTPVDPAVMQRCASNFWAAEKDTVTQELNLHLAYGLHLDGSCDNDSTRYLRQLLAGVEGVAQASTQPEITDRDDVPRLYSFWTEIVQFMSQVLSPTKLHALLADLEAGAIHASNREVVVQESLSAFNQRLDTVYPDFSDISGPIQLALLYAKLGIHLVADGMKNANESQEQHLHPARAVVAFPSLQSAKLLRRVEVPRSLSVSAVVPSLVHLAGIALEAAVTSDVRAPQDQTHAIFEQVFGLWSVEQSRNAQAERERQSLYRHQDDAITEAELEEQDFLATFPQFEDVLEDDPTAVHGATVPAPAKRPILFDPVHVVTLGRLYEILYSDNDTQPVKISETFAVLRQSIIEVLLDEGQGATPSILDPESRAYQVALLHRALALFEESQARTSTYNFYVDPNVPESKKAIIALKNLQRRLAILVQEWPDQMVLQHLRARCETALCLHVSSPIAKILSALEQLVLHIDDWEMYANRENTLKSHQQALTSLIVDWRRLELSCWQSVLRSQAERFSNGVYDWWFRLYDAAVRGVISAIGEELKGQDCAVTRYLDGLVPLLDEFVVSSPIGQYEARLNMLLAFSSHAEHLSCSQLDDPKRTFVRVHRILRSTWRYYYQFVPRVRSSLLGRQAELEKEVHDFIKLASWKDINVHALKQSAQRSHKQLYRVIRKYRDVLRQPAKECFKLSPEFIPEQPPFPEAQHGISMLGNVGVSIPGFLHDASLPSFLANLDTTYKSFRALSSGRLAYLITPASIEGLGELTSDIIATSQSLATSAPPSSASSAQRTKFFKALMNRKRRAWSDLLKELKRIGLSANVKPELLEQLRNIRWVREQEVLHFPQHCEQGVRRADSYFGRISNTLPEIRNLMSNHHQDVGTRELQRSLAFLESGFAMAIDTRRRYASYCDHSNHILMCNNSIDRAGVPFDQLCELIDRLQVLASDSAVLSMSNEFSPEHIIGIEAHMHRVVHALEEMLVHLRNHNDCSPVVVVPGEMLDEAQSFVVSSRELAQRLSDVARNVKLTPVLVLLAGT